MQSNLKFGTVYSIIHIPWMKQPVEVMNQITEARIYLSAINYYTDKLYRVFVLIAVHLSLFVNHYTLYKTKCLRLSALQRNTAECLVILTRDWRVCWWYSDWFCRRDAISAQCRCLVRHISPPWTIAAIMYFDSWSYFMVDSCHRFLQRQFVTHLASSFTSELLKLIWLIHRPPFKCIFLQRPPSPGKFALSTNNNTDLKSNLHCICIITITTLLKRSYWYFTSRDLKSIIHNTWLIFIAPFSRSLKALKIRENY